MLSKLNRVYISDTLAEKLDHIRDYPVTTDSLEDFWNGLCRSLRINEELCKEMMALGFPREIRAQELMLGLVEDAALEIQFAVNASGQMRQYSILVTALFLKMQLQVFKGEFTPALTELSNLRKLLRRAAHGWSFSWRRHISSLKNRLTIIYDKLGITDRGRNKRVTLLRLLKD